MVFANKKTFPLALLAAFLLGTSIFMAAPARAEDGEGEEEECAFACWLGKLVVTVPLIEFDDDDISGRIIDLVIRDIELGNIATGLPGTDTIDDPNIHFSISLPSVYVSGRMEIKYSVFDIKGNISGTASDASFILGLALQMDDRGLIEKTYVPADEGEYKGCYIGIGGVDLDIILDNSALNWLVGIIQPLLEDVLLGMLGDLVCPEIRDLVEVNLTEAFGMANEFIEKYWEQPANITLPLLKPMVDLRTSPLVDGLQFALNKLIGYDGPLNVSYIMELFTKGSDAFALSTFVPDGFEFTIPIDDINATIIFGLRDVIVTGLNTWSAIDFFVPKTEVLLDSHTDLAKLGINISWYINVSVKGDMIYDSESLYEDAIIATHMHDNVMKLGVQLASPSGVAGTYSQKQFMNMDCLGALIDPNGTGLSYFDLNMSFDYIVLDANQANLEEDVRDFINKLAKLFIDNYYMAIPPFVNGLMGELAMPALNDLLSGLIGGVNCPPLEDEPFIEVDSGATAASFSVAIVLGILVSIAPCIVVFKPSHDDDDEEADPDYERVNSSATSNVEMSDLSCTPGVSPFTPHMANSANGYDDDDMPPPPCPSDEEVKRQTMSYGAGDDDDLPPPCPSDEEVKRQTGVDNGGDDDVHPTYLFGCSGGGPLRELLRTDEDGASLFLHPQVSLFVRLFIPVLLFATIALFISSNTGVGASVFVYLTVGDVEVGLPSLFDFGLINSVTDMWTAGVYPLSILIAFMSGIWPYLKVVLMIGCWFFPVKWMKVSTRGSMLSWLDFLGKWSLLDTYVMIMMLVAFHFRIDFPVVNPDAVENSIRADIYVYPAYGFVSLIIATLISLLMSHIIIGIHRKTLPDTPGADCDDAQNWRIIAFYSVKKLNPIFGWIVVIAIGIVLVLMFVFTIIGSVLNTFSFNFIGLAGWALPFLDINPNRAYSVITLTEEVPPSARRPNSFTVRFTQIIFILTAFVFPLLHIVSMIVLWLAPLTRKIQHYLYYVTEILSAWACIDVFTISIIAAVLEIEQFADFMVGDMCDFLNPIMEEYLYDVLKPYIKCFGVVAKLKSGCWILFITAIVYLILNFGLLRLVHFGLAVRANNGEIPTKTEEELIAEEKKKKKVNAMKSVGSKIFTSEATMKSKKGGSKSPQATAKSQYNDSSISIQASIGAGDASEGSATVALEASVGPSPMSAMAGNDDDDCPPPPPSGSGSKHHKHDSSSDDD